ncbi:MAG: hypothetical protein ACYSWO_28660 [Planctomycetota bacterium]|jgi:hypothetical protein
MRQYFVSEKKVDGEWVPKGLATGTDDDMMRRLLGYIGNDPNERLRRSDLEEFREFGVVLGVEWAANYN